MAGLMDGSGSDWFGIGSKPITFSTSRNRANLSLGRGAKGKSSGRPSLSRGGPISDISAPPSPDTPGGTDTSFPDRATGTKQVDRISRPSLFGQFGDTLGDAMAGTSYVRSSDPFLAFGQGFAGARAARSQRLNSAYDRSVAAADKDFQHNLETEKLKDEQKRTDLYGQAIAARGAGKALTDGKGNPNSEGYKFLIQQDIALEKSLIGSHPDWTIDQVNAAVAKQRALNEIHLRNGDLTPEDATNTGGDAEAAFSEAPVAPPGGGASSGGGVMGAINSAGNAAIDTAEALGSDAVNAAGAGLRWAFGPGGSPTPPATPPPDTGAPPAPQPAPPPVSAGAPPAPTPAGGAPAIGVAKPAALTPTTGAANPGAAAAYAKARAMLSSGVPRAEVEQALISMHVDPSGL